MTVSMSGAGARYRAPRRNTGGTTPGARAFMPETHEADFHVSYTGSFSYH